MPSAYNLNGKTSVDDDFSGVPVLHGSPRQHIWIFAAGGRGLNYCPCDTSPYTLHIPSFVGKDYFCESGYVYPGVHDYNY